MFKFIKEDEYFSGEFPLRVEYTFQSDVTWMEAMDGFVQFLKGCGYFLPSDYTATIIDNETGKDVRVDVDSLWDKYAEGEENANSAS